jgi:hypothetical protein
MVDLYRVLHFLLKNEVCLGTVLRRIHFFFLLHLTFTVVFHQQILYGERNRRLAAARCGGRRCAGQMV